MLLRSVLLSALGLAFFGQAAAADRAPAVDDSHPMSIVYPLTAQRAGEEGTVVLRVYVTSTGKPHTVQVVGTSGHTDLDNAAIESALSARYLPAIQGGAITADWATVQVVYKLPAGAPGAQ